MLVPANSRLIATMSIFVVGGGVSGVFVKASSFGGRYRTVVVWHAVPKVHTYADWSPLSAQGSRQQFSTDWTPRSVSFPAPRSLPARLHLGQIPGSDALLVQLSAAHPLYGGIARRVALQRAERTNVQLSASTCLIARPHADRHT